MSHEAEMEADRTKATVSQTLEPLEKQMGRVRDSSAPCALSLTPNT